MLKYFIIVITCCNATLQQEMQVVRNALQTTSCVRNAPNLFDISIR